jgi:hypothetical protein
VFLSSYRSRENDIGRTVQRGLCRVLQDTDNESDSDDLHRDVAGYAEQAAAEWNQQQRPTGNT